MRWQAFVNIMNKFDSHDFAIDEVITWEMVLNDSQNKPRRGTGMLPQEYFYTVEPITKNVTKEEFKEFIKNYPRKRCLRN